MRLVVEGLASIPYRCEKTCLQVAFFGSSFSFRLAKYTVSGLSLLSCVDEDFISFVASPQQRLLNWITTVALSFFGGGAMKISVAQEEAIPPLKSKW